MNPNPNLTPRTTDDLLAAYRHALDELDHRPAQYTPRRQATAQGDALLLRPSIEAADAEVRARKLFHEARAAAARALRDRQRRHPLYNTPHRNLLLKNWRNDGPDVPPLALDGFTDWIARHADAGEDDVRKQAEALQTAAMATITDRLGDYAAKFFRTDRPTPRTERNFRRTLRAAYRQFNEQAAHILGIVKKGSGQEYVSNITRNNRRWQLAAQQKWINATTVSDGETTVKLADCIRTGEHRYSELYTLVKGQESYFTSQSRVALFVTLTSPAEYHPSPAHGRNQWDGSSVRDSHAWFNENWQCMRADLAKHGIKLDGFRVTEPHKDGSEHWHLMNYVKKNQLATIKSTFLDYFGHSEHSVKFKADFSKNIEEKKATAASYMLKYLIKTINRSAAEGTSAANDEGFGQEADAADAWRSTWGIRGFQFFGVLFGKQTLWRELRRLEQQPEEKDALTLWRAARGGRAHLFLACITEQEPALATLREIITEWTDPDLETGETFPTEKKGRVVGVAVNHIQYITHTSKWTLETDYRALNEEICPVTVMHKNPRGLKSEAANPKTEKDDPLLDWLNDIFSPPQNAA